ncbi:GL19829 [Drosophila persimilis]|uniref:GL19829 n=1 Tax=Drosophila persimilis TaxID=7234 RepID=B4GYC1_DROPE|nr:GL19829 [Drosophila persimilis]
MQMCQFIQHIEHMKLDLRVFGSGVRLPPRRQEPFNALHRTGSFAPSMLSVGMCLIGMGSVLLGPVREAVSHLKVFGAAAGALGVARLTSVWQLKQQESQSVSEDSRESHKCVQ